MLFKKRKKTDGMQSKWVPILRMIWQAFLHPPNNLKPHEWGEAEFGVRRPKKVRRDRKEGGKLGSNENALVG